MNSVMKTRQKWLKMSKVVIAWTIWTKGQIGGQKMLNQTKCALTQTRLGQLSKTLIKNTFTKEMLPRRCTKMEHPLYTEFMSGEGL